MVEFHPVILKKHGKNDFVVLPWEEFVALQEALADAQDLADLREAVRAEKDAPTIGLDELKHVLASD